MTILIASIPIVECKQLLAANSALDARILNLRGGITAPAGNSYCLFLTGPPILATWEADPRSAGGIFCSTGVADWIIQRCAEHGWSIRFLAWFKDEPF
jgi:hypothetical protein